ncbi:EF-hand domain pair [Artemisia annua]|uniref:EF-hand domain pair n=1 Tax=Artemisia annua TaxID=35608 RepID=A0A2U1PEG7_ARTAN|nr:EF-hand domain pair [Artemisia annua]
MKSFQVIALTLSMLMIISMVKGRWLDLETYSTSMISDGVHNIFNENPPNLHLEISNSSTLYAEQRCESLYGFLPCADTMPEGVFLMFMYMYFMMLGEEWIHIGSEALNRWFGDKALGAGVFRVLMALPRIIVVVVSGFFSSASDAQNQVVFGVSMYAGSTVITLTLIWGIRIILSRHKIKKRSSRESDRQQDSSKHKLSFLTDTGVNIDKETGDIAVIMLLSLIPFAFVGLLHFINIPAMTLFALIVSGVSLILYWVYQVANPWIRFRSLAYLKQENLRTRLFYHLQELAHNDLLNEQGDFNFPCLERIFDKADKDGDGSISRGELEQLFKEVFELEKDNISIEYAKAEILIHFDKDEDGEIKRVKKIAINKQRSNLTIIEQIMPRILKQVHEKHELVKEDGEPDREKIVELFSQYDKDNNDEIHRDELKQFIKTIQFGIPLDHDRVLDELVKDFGDGKNHSVGKNKFVNAFIEWTKKAINHDQSIKDPKEAIAKFEKDIWEEIDTPVKREKPKARIVYAIFGIAIMITISSAFITSVTQFSTAAHIPFLFTSFVMVPIALNAKMVINALLEARPHERKNASLAFSEIYDGLVMNNLLGLLTLLVTVYVKGLSWTYSAEMLAIMIPCAIVGTFAIKHDNYPLWASISAILLYPVSVYIYYVLANAS